MNIRISLGVLGLVLAQDAFADRPSCQPVALREADRVDLNAEVGRLVPTELDLGSIFSCKSDGARFASVDTFPVTSPDGAEFWVGVECWQGKRRSTAWECSVQAMRGVRVDRPSGPSPVKVVISPNADPSVAQKLTSRALALLGSPGKLPGCHAGGDKSPKTHKEVVADFEDSLGPYHYDQAAGTFTLSRGLLSITFWLPVGGDEGPRIDCWSVEDIVVTS
jgi:hypothetical protein